MVSTSPLPSPVLKTGRQVVPSSDASIRYARANPASQISWIRSNDCTEPRSTCTHCGSDQSLAQRVVLFPSVTFDGGYGAPLPTCWYDDAVAVLPRARF